MTIKSKYFGLLCINLICIALLGIIVTFALDLFELPAEIRDSSIVTKIIGPKIPTEKDLERLKEETETILDFLEEHSVEKDSIAEIYTLVQEAPVCSEANRNFNQLAEQYDIYIEQVEEILKRIEGFERKYNRYIQLLDNIPQYSKSLREEYETKFAEAITPSYEFICSEKEKCLSDKADVEEMYTLAKKRADDLFDEYYEPMCHIVNAEGAVHAWVANVIENRIKDPSFPNDVVSVIFAPGQYSPTWNGSYYKEPSAKTRQDVEEYLRGRVETGMPDNVVYQALFKQGSGVWNEVPGGNIFCYK